MLIYIFCLVLLAVSTTTSKPEETTEQPAFEEAGSASEDLTAKGIYTGWGDIPPFLGIVRTYDDWRIRIYSFADAVYDKQGGKRGQTGFYSPNAFAIAAQKEGEKSSLILSCVLSLEPFTIGPCGYPLLLSAGGTTNNITALVDRGLPFTLPTELGVTYTINPAKGHALFTYWAPVGPAALGPVASQFYTTIYMPELPITYANFNSTRISYGVITGGYTYKTTTFEASVFKGQGGGQRLVTIEEPRFDSYSSRLVSFFDPFIAQVSYGFIKSPDVTVPVIDVRRFTTSASFFKKWDATYAEITVGWGRDTYLVSMLTPNPIINNLNHKSFNAFFLEGICNINNKHIFFTRGEVLETVSLLPRRCPVRSNALSCCSFERQLDRDPDCIAARRALRGQSFTVGKLAGGYLRQLFFWNNIRFGVGISANISFVPPVLYPCYGKNPFSYFLFARAELADESEDTKLN